MRGTELWSVSNLGIHAATNSVEIEGACVPARPLGRTGFLFRLRLAWGVFIGTYDAVCWPRNQ